MKLTIGMAHFDDFHGVIFSIQSIRLNNIDKDLEIIVIDNSPKTTHGKAVKAFCSKAGAIYIPFEHSTGTSQTRQAIFDNATGDAVVCMDCHVLLPSDAIDNLITFYSQNLDTKNLYTGPLLLDGLNTYSTHFDLLWRKQMWGVWGYARECKHCGKMFSYQAAADFPHTYTEDLYLTMETDQKNLHGTCTCGQSLTASSHNRATITKETKPFQVPAQGLGLFSCMRHAWLGFNPNFQHFGGEEGYIHYKYERAGQKTICLPFLQWWHRFTRPDGVPYPLTAQSKIKNYIYGFMELEKSLDEIKNHFISEGVISENDWKALKAETKSAKPVAPTTVSPTTVAPQQSTCKPGCCQQEVVETEAVDAQTPEEIFNFYKTPTDDFIHKYFEQSKSVAVYSNAAGVFFNAMTCDNIDQLSIHHTEIAVAEGIKEMSTNDQMQISALPFESLFKPKTVDVLFLEADIHDNALRRLLSYNRRVGKYILSKRSLNTDIVNSFMQQLSWKIASTQDQFVILERGKTAMLLAGQSDNYQTGPGTELTKILRLFGITYTPECACGDRAKFMNSVGIEWCKANKQSIVAWMKEEAEKRKLPFWKFGATMIVTWAIFKSQMKNRKK